MPLEPVIFTHSGITLEIDRADYQSTTYRVGGSYVDRATYYKAYNSLCWYKDLGDHLTEVRLWKEIGDAERYEL